MLIIPAIDLLGGQVVRLKQGQYKLKTIYNNKPVAQAEKFVAQGARWLHIVDLDGARSGKMANLTSILQIRENIKIPLQVGGGIRSLEQIDELLERGASRVVLGTRAIEEPEFLTQALQQFGREKIAVSLDIKGKKVMIKGWQMETRLISSPQTLLSRLRSTVLKYLIYTDIKKDGLMLGPNFDNIKRLQRYGFNLLIAGGVSTDKDIKKLKKLGVYGCIIGQAVYEDTKFLKRALSI